MNHSRFLYLFLIGQENCVSCAFRTHNLQSSPDLMQASGQGALTTAPYQPARIKRRIKEKINELFQAMCWLSINRKALNLNQLNRARSTSPLAQFNIRVILNRVYVQLDARLIKKDYRKIVYSWKSSELESAEQCEGKSIKYHP